MGGDLQQIMTEPQKVSIKAPTEIEENKDGEASATTADNQR